AEDGIRDLIVTGVQTCALPILDELRAAIGLAQLKKLKTWNEKRKALSCMYQQALAAYCPAVGVPLAARDNSSHHIMPIVLPSDEIGRASWKGKSGELGGLRNHK